MSAWKVARFVFIVALASSCADRQSVAFVNGRLMVVPGALDFSQVGLHDSKDLSVALKNVGRGRLDIRDAWVKGPDGAYAIHVTPETPCRILPGATCKVNVHFTPLTLGPLVGELVVRTDTLDGDPLGHVPLKGIGIDAHADLGTTVLDFGRIEAQSKKTLPIALTNSSPLPVTVTSASQGTDADEFSAASPFTVAPGQTANLPVTFAPARVGVKSASLFVTPCSGCSAKAVTLIAEALDKAVLAEPWVIDFGSVPSDFTKQLPLQLHNISTEPATVTTLVLAIGTDPGFTQGKLPAFPLVLEPGQVMTFPELFSPAHMNDAQGAVDVHLLSVRNPVETVQLKGFGGAPVLCITPLQYDFGSAPVGAKVAKVVNIRNCGTTNANPISIQAISFSDGDTSQFAFVQVPLPQILAANQEINVKFFFEPTRAGGATVNVTIQSEIDGIFTSRVQLGGIGVDYPPCTLSLTPPSVDFGTLLPGKGGVLGVKVTNQGSALCAIRDVHVVEDAAGRFTMPGGPVDGVVLKPGEYFTFEVGYLSSQTAGPATGLVQMQPAGSPLISVPLSADTEDACLVANPRFLDFGVNRPDCPPPNHQVNLVNGCASPLTLSQIAIGPGTSDGQFTLVAPPATPLSLSPGAGVKVTVNYSASLIGLNLSPLFVTLPGIAKPLLISLIGESSGVSTVTDAFTQQSPGKVDVLLVVDNSKSMVDKVDRIQAAMPPFVNALQTSGVDFHIAVTTMGVAPATTATCPGGVNGAEAGRFFPVDHSSPRILTSATPGLAAALQADTNVGHCQIGEQGYEPFRRALSDPLVNHADDPLTPEPSDGNYGFLRPDAALAVVFISDDDDHSPDSVATYVQFLRSLKGGLQPQRATLYAVGVSDQPCADASNTGTRYLQGVTATGGDFLSICAADYSPLLVTVATHGYGPQAKFPLTATPQTATLQVTVNGVASSDWTYDAPTNSVVFNAAPAAGSQVKITYTRVCG